MTDSAGALLQLMWQIRCPLWMPSSRKLYACTTLRLSCFDGPWKTSWWTATLSSQKYVSHHIVLCNCLHIGRGGLGQSVYCPSVTCSYAQSSSAFSRLSFTCLGQINGGHHNCYRCLLAGQMSQQQSCLLPITVYPSVKEANLAGL